MSADIRAKLEETARMLDGKVKEPGPNGGLVVSVHGYVAGFPCRLEAISPNWPFAVNYSVDTEVIPRIKPANESFSLTVVPRIGKGLLGFVTRLLFFESWGMKVPDKELDKSFIFIYTNRPVVDRFLRYPGISEILIKLHRTSFNELKIVSNIGLYLSQPKSFSRLDPDVCRETFRLLADIGQVLYEAF